MRIILEKKEIVQILGKHFESNFDPDSVIIRTDPLEVELRDIPMPVEVAVIEDKVTPAPKQHAESSMNPVQETSTLADEGQFRARAHGPNAFLEAPPPGLDGIKEGLSNDGVAALLENSRTLQAELDRKRGGAQSDTPKNFNEEVS